MRENLETGFYVDDVKGMIVKVVIFNNGFFNQPVLFSRIPETSMDRDSLSPLNECDDLAEFFEEDFEWILSNPNLTIEFHNHCIENELYMMLHFMQCIKKQKYYNKQIS